MAETVLEVDSVDTALAILEIAMRTSVCWSRPLA